VTEPVADGLTNSFLSRAVRHVEAGGEAPATCPYEVCLGCARWIADSDRKFGVCRLTGKYHSFIHSCFDFWWSPKMLAALAAIGKGPL
jgi:hypothetical protein